MQTLIKPLRQNDKKDVSIIVYLLNVVSGKVNSKTEICGISMTEWVKKALKDVPYVELDYDGGDIIDFLKPRLVNSKFSVVLFSNTPLITTPSVLKIMEYVVIKDINACKFNGGFAFKNEYIKQCKKVMIDSYLPLDDKEFMVVNNHSSFEKAKKLLQCRIIQDHINNGVEVFGNCEIGGQVEIEPGCMIFSGNIIKGNTVIGAKTILKENNTIENCIIGQDVCISSSNLIESKVENNVFILPFCYINNSTIRKNCYISSNVSVENRTIRAGTRLQKENK